MPKDPVRVSTLSRVLAWVLVLIGLFAISGLARDIYIQKTWPWSWGETIPIAFLLLFYFVLSGYVALRGRSPRWLTSAENIYDTELGRSGTRVGTSKLFRNITFAVASAVFGLFLLYFGNQLELFAGANRWFAMSVFAIAWLIVVVCMWRYSTNRQQSKGERSPNADPK